MAIILQGTDGKRSDPGAQGHRNESKANGENLITICVSMIYMISKKTIIHLFPSTARTPPRQHDGFHKLLPTLVFHPRARDVSEILPIQMFYEKPALHSSMPGESQCGP